MTDHDGITRRLEHRVHRSLLAGLVLSTFLLLAGLSLNLAAHGDRPSSPARSSWSAPGPGGHAPPATRLLDLGLLALIATPVLRVAVLGAGWLAAREYRFAAVALTVLGLLVLSLFLGYG